MTLEERFLVELMSGRVEAVTLAGHQAHAVNASCLHAELGDAMLHRGANGAQGAPELAVLYFWDGSKYQVTLRSRLYGPDVARIAASFSGGGHPNAAGFECTELPWRASGATCGHVFPNGQACARPKHHFDVQETT